jgi:flagellar hook-length control protein FliK
LKIDLANLGPPAKGLSGLESLRQKALPADSLIPKAEGADSFDQMLSKADASENVRSEVPEARVVPSKSVPGKSTQNAQKDSSQYASEIQDKSVTGNTGRILQNESSADPEAKDTVTKKSREQAMLQFMDSMESELGIPPQEVAQAMADLSVEDLQKPASETAGLVISQLELNPKEAEKAMALYLGMIAQVQTEPVLKKEGYYQPPAVMVNPAVLPAAKNREALNNSLDQMNSKFFMWDKSKIPQKNLTPDLEGGKQTDKNEFIANPDAIAVEDGFYSKPKMIQVPQFEAQLPDRPFPDSNLQKLSQLEGRSATGKSSQNEQLLEKLSALGAAATALNESMKTDPRLSQPNVKMPEMQQATNDQQGKIPVDQLTAALPGQQIAINQEQSKSQFGPEGQSKSSQSKTEKISQSKGQLPGGAGEFFTKTLESTTHSNSLHSAGADLSLPALTPQNHPESTENIRQLMNQAQYLIKKGGGEMNVQLTPEGLGKLQMKVIVSDGKVDVQMQTETKEAKKALESSIGELKSSLGIHKLSLEHLKVDVGQKLADNSGNFNDTAQKQSDQRNDLARDNGRDGSREQARQFLGQFRDETFNQRGFLFDTAKPTRYSAGPSVDPLKPAPMQGNSVKRYSGQGKGSGLDLVV